MIGVYATIPVACFRRGMAREFLETEELPPPSSAYGFMLSLVGETNRFRHIGVRISPVLLSSQKGSIVLRTLWRIKSKNHDPGDGNNARPDYQQLLTNTELVIWIDSTDESLEQDTLEKRVKMALDPDRRKKIHRFGGLSLGESTHLVNEVSLFNGNPEKTGRAFLLAGKGSTTLPVWVDHVGSEGTRYVTGNLVEIPLTPPNVEKMPVIQPHEIPTS